MTEQIYGIFDSIENAERAISAFKDHAVENVEISVVRRHDGAGLPIVEDAGSHGLTSTSEGDVVAGAVKGGSVGLALGVLGGIVALTIPGIGPILAAGPLWAAFGATLVSTALGTVGGGVVGYLVDQGVAEAAAVRYHEALERGDILVSIRSAHISNADALMLLEKYGATEIEEHPIADARPAAATAGASLEPPLVDREIDINSPSAVAVEPVRVPDSHLSAVHGTTV